MLSGVAETFGAADKFSSIATPRYFWFKESPKISTYLYAIVAGPFDYFENIKEGLPPMRIYARKSLKDDINHKDMFNITQIGIKHYTQLFGCEYPFGKYD